MEGYHLIPLDGCSPLVYVLRSRWACGRVHGQSPKSNETTRACLTTSRKSSAECLRGLQWLLQWLLYGVGYNGCDGGVAALQWL